LTLDKQRAVGIDPVLDKCRTMGLDKKINLCIASWDWGNKIDEITREDFGADSMQAVEFAKQSDLTLLVLF
jgi:hypothetical protein